MHGVREGMRSEEAEAVEEAQRRNSMIRKLGSMCSDSVSVMRGEEQGASCVDGKLC